MLTLADFLSDDVRPLLDFVICRVIKDQAYAFPYPPADADLSPCEGKDGQWRHSHRLVDAGTWRMRQTLRCPGPYPRPAFANDIYADISASRLARRAAAAEGLCSWSPAVRLGDNHENYLPFFDGRENVCAKTRERLYNVQLDRTRRVLARVLHRANALLIESSPEWASLPPSAVPRIYKVEWFVDLPPTVTSIEILVETLRRLFPDDLVPYKSGSEVQGMRVRLGPGKMLVVYRSPARNGLIRVEVRLTGNQMLFGWPEKLVPARTPSKSLRVITPLTVACLRSFLEPLRQWAGDVIRHVLRAAASGQAWRRTLADAGRFNTDTRPQAVCLLGRLAGGAVLCRRDLTAAEENRLDTLRKRNVVRRLLWGKLVLNWDASRDLPIARDSWMASKFPERPERAVTWGAGGCTPVSNIRCSKVDLPGVVGPLHDLAGARERAQGTGRPNDGDKDNLTPGRVPRSVKELGPVHAAGVAVSARAGGPPAHLGVRRASKRRGSKAQDPGALVLRDGRVPPLGDVDSS